MADSLQAPLPPEAPYSEETIRLMVAQALTSGQVAVVVTRADDGHPIVWADDSFTALTGYPLDETLGRSHVFLHGPGTDEESVARMRARMHGDDATTNTLLLYRKGGTPFWDRVVIVPIHDSTGQTTHHAHIHTDATADIVREWTLAAEDALAENRADRLELNNLVVGAMTEHVDYRQAAAALARTAIPQLADWGILILFDDDGRPDLLTVVAADPAKSAVTRTVEANLRDRMSRFPLTYLLPGLDRALSSQPWEPIPPVPVDLGLLAERVDSAAAMQALYDLGLGARLPVPLNTPARLLGLMVLEARNPDRFDVPTVVTTTLLRSRVTSVLDKIRHYQERRPTDPTSPPRRRSATVDTGPRVDDSAGMEIAVRALRTSELPVLVTDTMTGKIVWANDPYCRMVGWSQAELVGRSWQTVHASQPDEAYTAQKIDALMAGSTVTTTQLSRRKDGTRFWSRMTVTPVHDARGEITHTFAVHAEATETVVTEHVQAAEAELAANRGNRLELITQAVDALTGQDDYHQAAEALARVAVPELADWGFIVLFGDDGRPDHVTDIVADPAQHASARTARRDLRSWLAPSCGLTATPHKARPDDLLVPQPFDVDRLDTVVPDRLVMEALHDLGLGAQLAVPLFARDRTLGMLVLNAHDPDRFDVATVVTATLLRNRVGTVLDTIRLYQTERQAVLTLQHRLLPPTTTVDGLDTATVYRPSARAEIGGDWYDVFPLGERGTMLAVGDVVGHDMAAAAAMGQLSVLLRARSWNSGSPGTTLSILVQALDGMGWDDLASVVCMRWQPTADGGCHLEYANLGHVAPFVRLPDGSVYHLPAAHGLPLGLHDPTVDVPQDELDLPAGAVLVLYTDGLVERRDRPLKVGLADLARALRDAPDGTAAQIRDHLLARLVHEQPEDDLCLLVVRGTTASG